MTTAKIFQHGGSQAVRLPKEYRFESETVRVRREGAAVILEPTDEWPEGYVESFTGAPEDFRYQAMRRHWGARFPTISLVTVFLLQGVLMWVVSLPVQLGSIRSAPDPGVLCALGVAIWLVGFGFETIGDAQLARFKADPASAGQVMDRGLWRYTRHPTYFGDACVWWGIALVAAETGLGAVGIIGAVVMNVLLVRVSGVPMLERSMAKRRPGYPDYVARTSGFFPRPPRDPSR